MSKKVVSAGMTLACFTALVSGAYAHEDHHPAANVAGNGIFIGGAYEFQAAMPDQDIATMHGRTLRDVGFANITQVHVVYKHTAENGLKYGAVVQLQGDVSEPDEQLAGENANKTYLFAESAAGRVTLGNEYDATHLMEISAASFARATGGVHGDWEKYANMPHHHTDDFGVINPDGHFHEFISAPAMPIAHAHGEAQIANKASYFTPAYSGFQAGFSFTPDSGDAGTVSAATGKSGLGQFSNVVDAALAWRGTLGDIQLKASVSAEAGRSEDPLLNDIAAYAGGTSVSYKGFFLGGSYGYWGDSALITTYVADDSRYWDIGAGYEQDNWGISLGYLVSTYNGNDASLVSLGADITPVPGMTPYVEADFFSLDHATAADDSGSIVLAGVKLRF